jgi:cytoskeletal protein CcmA (bactofilin family)
MSFLFGGRGKDREEESAPKQLPEPQGARQPVGFETVLGQNVTLRGELHSAANIRIDGAFEGTLNIDGNILIGENAKVIADLNADDSIVIAGAVRGNVNGTKVQILQTGKVWGDITANTITTQEGAFIDGAIRMVSQEPPPTFDDADEEPEEVSDETFESETYEIEAPEPEPVPAPPSDEEEGVVNVEDVEPLEQADDEDMPIAGLGDPHDTDAG